MKTIAIAESCTGGLISHLITNRAGSSQYFKLGVVAYSKEIKISLLKIPPQAIEQFGSVSPEIALSMAHRVRELAGTDIGLGISGIAGPSYPEGEEEKPIGLVYIAVCSAQGDISKEFNFEGSREEIKKKAAEQALGLLEIAIKQE
ncbi:MAG: hypothetical protein B5M48_01030 [Candidatus Omnitrophica bacterium 4484_213]|nr:MAG: hypothetical protein B5M48_01030 [Candidatus Omnitrophica bacterium 4484_213]